MTFKVSQSEFVDILQLRNLFLQETNCQIRYNACHERGWADYFIIHDGSKEIGYGAMKGEEREDKRDYLFEFYTIPSYRNQFHLIVPQLLEAAEAKSIECQSNDLVLTSVLYQYAEKISSNVILFKDHIPTQLTMGDGIFRTRIDPDAVFDHHVEPVGNYLLELRNEVVATGGFLLHYNKPFADLFMEVKEQFRKQGIGSFLIQEIKKQCYLAGRVPAARCDIGNIASRKTLIRAGLDIAGYMLTGNIRKERV